MALMKTQERRLQECLVIRKKLNELGLNDMPELDELKKIMKDYIHIGVSYSGKIKLETLPRVVEYILSNKEHIESKVILRRVPGSVNPLPET